MDYSKWAKDYEEDIKKINDLIEKLREQAKQADTLETESIIVSKIRLFICMRESMLSILQSLKGKEEQQKRITICPSRSEWTADESSLI